MSKSNHISASYAHLTPKKKKKHIMQNEKKKKKKKGGIWVTNLVFPTI